MSMVSLALGWLVAGRALKPVHSMTVAARRISDQNLGERLGIVGPNDELKALADTFDGMLGRLQEAFESQRRFVANASHELKTPLTFERTTLEVALADPNATADSLREACERVLATTEQQERLIEALLTLARGQRGLDRREPCDLADLTAQAIRSEADAAKVGGIRLDVDLQAAPTSGDTRLIERLVMNLLDNAIRYNSRGGWVEAHTAVESGEAVLRVSNSGPLVLPEQVDRLFEPFRRSSSDRTSLEGVGLGLSIVAAIVAAHGASVQSVAQTQGGLEIVVRFPPAAGV
jgi:signal transduction histidine kinase